MSERYTYTEQLQAENARLAWRLAQAWTLIEELRGGVERYNSDLCRKADEFLAIMTEKDKNE